ncbi:ABC transporter permease subunit [Methylobacterium sp.]|uniref:amino acid ABC transporter permease n=1 Tax=Methylobacterium sp. TaxID=409 RepID=UPI0025DC752F|nr:ABC transporter permease subunit [Methylobacterium sp.]
MRLRSLAVQAALLLAIAALAYAAAGNASEKLARQGIVAGFDFLGRVADFDISQRLVAYSAATSTYAGAILVGLLNTLLVSALGIVLATILGFTIGIARRGPNLLARWLAAAYVDLFRNLPLLLQLLVWYVAVRIALPDPQHPASFAGAYLSQRGLYLPWIDPAGSPAVSWPQAGPYDIEGGLSILPEFAALLLGLSTYTAAFIAEIVRAGLASVSAGQNAAALALGMTRAQALRSVVVPQAMRVIVPPLTSQYLTLTKNSSLAVLIGYPDLVHVVMGTVLNQTNQAMEAVAITMAVYLTISLATALAMNLYNRRIAPVER